MFDAQNGRCVIPSCLKDIAVVDHDHKTETVRGLMCHGHNIALGLFNDNPRAYEKLPII